MVDYPSQNQEKFVLRLPDGMRDRIKDVAVKNNRSMNAEIVARLEQSMSKAALSGNSDLSSTDLIPVKVHVPYFLLRALQARQGLTVGAEDEIILQILMDAFPGVPTMQDLTEAEMAIQDRLNELFSYERLEPDQIEKVNEIFSAVGGLTDLMALSKASSSTSPKE